MSEDTRARILVAMASDRPALSVGPILRFQPDPPRMPIAGVHTVVLDTAWTPDRGAETESVVGLRDVADRVLADRDFLAESAARLDEWATASDIVATMSVEGTSFWYQGRVRHGLWLHERLLWLALVDDQVRRAGPSAIECEPGCDGGLVAVAELVAARDGIAFRAAGVSTAAPAPAAPLRTSSDDPPVAGAATQRAPATRSGILRRLRRRLMDRVRPSDAVRRRRFVADRLAALSKDPGRLLVVETHARQRVETATGPRFMNAYLGPVIDRLRGTALDPLEVEVRTRLNDAATWTRFSASGSERVLPGDVIWTTTTADDPVDLQARAGAVADAVAGAGTPLPVSGVDLGPAMAHRVAGQVRETFARNLHAVSRLRLIIGRLRPSLILMADEYHRQDWLTAARLEGVPTVAIQHGMIYRWHNGYMHRDRPDQLALVDRTYVFGQWERRLLLEHSVYRDDEVRVGGSPRLDLAGPRPAAERDQVRAELGVATGDRLVVVSGTWGPIYRQFHFPIALANLIDRPLPGVHLVVKLHPGERDEGPYRAVIEGVAAAQGFEPPPVSVVQSVDLYRLLRAADAHIGLQSTVLTEAVATGTLNLLAVTSPASDLLGYVEAGVAIPVRTGAISSRRLTPVPPQPRALRRGRPSWMRTSSRDRPANGSPQSCWHGRHDRRRPLPGPRPRRKPARRGQEPQARRRDPAGGSGGPDVAARGRPRARRSAPGGVQHR